MKSIKKIRSGQLNNAGSTLVTTLVIVAFIAILGTVSTSVAMINYKMKMVDRTTKKTFYSAEEAVDELYTGLGKLCMEQLDAAYTKEMAAVITSKQDPSDSSKTVLVRVENATCNRDMREIYANSVITKLIGTGSVAAGISVLDKTNLIANLNSNISEYLKNPADPIVEVKSVGNSYVTTATSEKNKDSGGIALQIYTVHVDDCTIEYKDAEGLYAQIVTDITLSLPDTMIDFTSGTTTTVTGTDIHTYSVIGAKGAVINNGAVVNLSSGSSLYAGSAIKKGLVIESSATLNSNGAVVVADGNVTVNSSTLKTSNGAELWCENLIVNASGSNIPDVSLGSNTTTIVKDDLQIEGDGTATSKLKVNLSGNYYGYSYEGKSSAKEHSSSSAILVNGKNVELDMTGLSELVLGGRAYIDFTQPSGTGTANGTSYMTGESLSLIGNQEVYLVPPDFITDGTGTDAKSMGNPYTKVSGKTPTITMNSSNFFGFTCLDPTTPYIEVEYTEGTSTKVYVYLNFASKELAAKYFKSIYNDTAYNELCVTAGASTDAVMKAAFDKSRAQEKKILENNMVTLSQSISNTGGASVYTSGCMISTDLTAKTSSEVTTSQTYTINGISTVDGFALNSLDLANRYACLKKILYTPEWNSDGNRYILYDTSELSTLGATGDIFSNIVNQTYLSANPVYTNGKANVRNSSTTIGSDGIWIVNGDATISSDFNGILICSGTVTFSGNASVNGYSDSEIKDIIEQDEDFAKYFNAYNSSTSSTGSSGFPVAISDVTYKNLVNFAGWEKH